MSTTMLEGRRSRSVALLLCASLAMFHVASRATAQEGGGEDELGGDEKSESTASAPATPEPAEEKPEPAAPAAPPPPATPPMPPPSPFTLVVKGLVSGSMFLQSAPAATGTGGSLTAGGIKVGGDGMFLGGDVRQSRLTFTIRGPEVLAGGTPTGVLEMDLGGYNYQITPVGGLSAVVGTPIPPSMANPAGGFASVALPYNVATNEPRFDESLVPHIRLAYVELNWNNSQNVLRVGQYHNLLLGMVAGSASHIATPLGYGAGQLGWRSPGVTYLHRFKVSADTNFDFGLQVNRNSWRDELPTCANSPAALATPQTQAPIANCLPYGVSAGEASMLPQVEGRLMIFGGMAEAPLPFYLPTKWQAYIVAHWDQKDLSGVGNTTTPAAPYRDTMTTFVTQAGFKTQLGPLLVAANGWYGKNAGNVFGHIFQMQDLNGPDVSGFGAWGQLGLGLTRTLSIWGFAGIDKPKEADVIAAAASLKLAGITRMQNMQFAGMIAYTEGPIQIGAEFLFVSTTNYFPEVKATATMAGTTAYQQVTTVSQPTITMNYNF